MQVGFGYAYSLSMTVVRLPNVEANRLRPKTNLFRIRRGLTLIEILVTVSVLIILVGLLLPAVLAARENSRRLHCSNSMYQIGLGVANFHSQYQHLPNDGQLFADISPQLEIKIDKLSEVPHFLRCPSEVLYSKSATNYFLNNGSSIDPRNGAVIGSKPPFREGKYLSYHEFTDGLSNTSYLSECKILTGRDDDRSWWRNKSEKRFGSREERELRYFLNSQWTKKQFDKTSDQVYISGQHIWNHFFYDHLWTPNRPSIYGVLRQSYDAVISPSSSHVRGVNLLFADGSVRFVSDDVDSEVWASVGSINGGEIVSLQ